MFELLSHALLACVFPFPRCYALLRREVKPDAAHPFHNEELAKVVLETEAETTSPSGQGSADGPRAEEVSVRRARAQIRARANGDVLPTSTQVG